MHPLTKEERKGAVAIALISLLICGGAAVMGALERNREEENEKEILETIIIVSDSVKDQDDQDENDYQFKRKNAKDYSPKKDPKRYHKNKGGAKSKGEKKNNSKEKNSPSPSRDFLSDPV